MMTLLVQSERLLANLRNLQKQAGKTPVIPLLEGNAGGLGDAATAKILASEGLTTLAVSRLEEAVRVAEAVRGMDILLLTPYAGEQDIQTILENDIIAAVGSNDEAVLLSSLSRTLHKRARIQLCFDFGMGRFGFAPQDAAKAAQTVRHLGNLELVGVYTVLPSGKAGKKARQNQQHQFERVLAALHREELSAGILHMADVAQAVDYPAMAYSAVRAGADLYGRGPLKDKHGLKKVGRLVSEICDVKWLAAGSTVGEDGRTKVRHATRVAIVPAGRADGLFAEDATPRSFQLPRRRYCEINGKRAPIIGRVGLTALTANVTDIDCAPGDIVAFDADPVDINAFVRRDYV